MKAAYLKYQNDPKVAFLLVSLDDDEIRLQRFMNDMKFPLPVARLGIEEAAELMGIDNVPATLYIDRGGIVRYQVGGSEPHGDSPERVIWYIDQLKK